MRRKPGVAKSRGDRRREFLKDEAVLDSRGALSIDDSIRVFIISLPGRDIFSAVCLVRAGMNVLLPPKAEIPRRTGHGWARYF